MIQFLSKILRWGEATGSLILIIAIFLKLMNLSEPGQLLMVGLLLLGTVYFLFGFTIPQLQPGEKKLVFADLLVNILQKVMYIGSSVLCIGYLFAILHLKGASEMILIGLLTLVGSLIVSGALILGKGERLALLRHPVMVSISLLLFYFVTPYLQ